MCVPVDVCWGSGVHSRVLVIIPSFVPSLPSPSCTSCRPCPGSHLTPLVCCPCRAACAASHLAWQDDPPAGGPVPPGRMAPVRDAQKVMAGLKRALKVVGAAKQQRAATARTKSPGQHLPLYVEILNHYLYYFDRGVETMTASVVQQLLELTASEFSSAGEGVADEETKRFWEVTKQHIRYQKAQAEAGGEGGRTGYAALTVPA